ncbi:MAG: hypothetical protein AB7T06_14485 [Kofleriaceae bacterium]
MRSSFLVLALASSLVPACADDSGDEPVDCLKEMSDDEFVIGLTKPGVNGLYNFTITSFTPAPPTRLLNEWTMSIMSTATPAAPLAATETLAMTPYMPQHGHGAGRDVEISPMPTAGEFKFSTINLHMAGIWEVTVEVDPGADNYDKVVFKPCIPE